MHHVCTCYIKGASSRQRRIDASLVIFSVLTPRGEFSLFVTFGEIDFLTEL